MQKLAEGIHEFQNNYFSRNRKMFEKLATDGQQPETLFITCSDSRVVPNLLTNAAPGELFIVRNIGNVVPKALPGGTAAALEYAIEVLNVEHVVICGHTHCGAIQALLDPSRMDRLPYVRRWLQETTRVRGIVEERYGHLQGDARMVAAIEENVLVQLENLRAFPFVAERLAAGKLQMSGWVFKIETGEVFSYDPDLGQFTRLAPQTEPPPSLSKGTP
ncbi:MAG TPA: carbonic anhydrase [Polyangiaceae bacterium]